MVSHIYLAVLTVDWSTLVFFLNVTSHLFQKSIGLGVFRRAFLEGQIPKEKYLSNLSLYLLASFKKMFATIIIFIIYLYILMLPDFLAFDI